jgi:hypothetical protein
MSNSSPAGGEAGIGPLRNEWHRPDDACFGATGNFGAGGLDGVTKPAPQVKRRFSLIERA